MLIFGVAFDATCNSMCVCVTWANFSPSLFVPEEFDFQNLIYEATVFDEIFRTAM